MMLCTHTKFCPGIFVYKTTAYGTQVKENKICNRLHSFRDCHRAEGQKLYARIPDVVSPVSVDRLSDSDLLLPSKQLDSLGSYRIIN